jgi:hypothetical protein
LISLKAGAIYKSPLFLAIKFFPNAECRMPRDL